jgi:hypothetical protein
MTLRYVERLGDWNPQWFRELKGRLKPRNILIAVAISLVGQLLLLMSFASQIPVKKTNTKEFSRYCTGSAQDYSTPTCLPDSFNGYLINWQVWWQDVFIWLSLIGLFALLVVGTYMLISDLAKEEHQGTLNFLRLSPQSSTSILMGKLLGVPIILYLVGFLAWPLHLTTGLSGGIPLHLIFVYYGVLGASCLFFYSAALLFGLVGKWLGGFQAWLGAGTVLLFLYATTLMVFNSNITGYPMDWLTLSNPSILLPHLIGINGLDAVHNYSYNSSPGLRDWNWFYLPLAARVWSTAGFMVLNYGLWSYWAWQGLKRCFHNPSATLLSKQQSYWLMACFQTVTLGFAVNPQIVSWRTSPKGLFENFSMLLVFDLILCLCLIAALSPHRQVMQDWARYRHQMQPSRKRGILQDLIWGEKSPALVAVVLNVAIASAILLPWILVWPESEYKTPALWGLLLNASLICVYAGIVQLMLFMKTPKRGAWAGATISSLIALPPIIFAFLSMEPDVSPGVWMFSAIPWIAAEQTTGMAVFLAVIGQSLMLGLLSVQLTRQLRQAGESSTKALLSGRSPAAIQ